MFRSKSRRANRAIKEQQQEPVNKQDYFHNCHRTYSCIHCRAHLANHDELISKLFQGNHGRAYLFNKVVNIGCRQAVQRELLTGLHAVADIYCDNCETTLGWKYEQAFVPSQKYKEGKYIIELIHMLKENDWDLTSYNAKELMDEAKISNPRLDSQNSKTSISWARHNRMNNQRYNRDESVGIRKDMKYPNEERPINDNGLPIGTSFESKDNLINAQHQLTNNQENIPHIISENHLEGINSSQLNAEVLSDGIELLERSMNTMQLLIRDEESDDTKRCSRNSLCSTRSQSDVSSSNSDIDAGNKLETENDGGDGSKLYTLKLSPIDNADNNNNNNETTNELKLNDSEIILDKPEVDS